MKERAILHADVNNFYASVEMLSCPELREVPLAVSGDPEKRHGIILAKNMLAKACGVATGEAIWLAKQKCRDLVTIMPNHKKYGEFSKIIFGIYTEFTSEVESFGLDECWLDVTESERLFGDPIQMAYKIKDEIKKRTGLTISIGVSFTKVFAKLGSDLKKPDAVSVISSENYQEVAWRLPVSDMLNVGFSTKCKLLERNIRTIGDLAKTKREDLTKMLGKFGDALWLSANGKDESPVKSYTESRIPESVGNGMTASQDISSLMNAEALCYSLSEVIAARLRGYHLSAMGVSVSLRNTALHTITRQTQLSMPTYNAKTIAEEAMKLIRFHYDFETQLPLRTVTVTAFHLLSEHQNYQSAFVGDGGRIDKLEVGVDKLRKKYGFGIITRGINIDTVFACDAGEIEDDFIPFGKGTNDLPE